MYQLHNERVLRNEIALRNDENVTDLINLYLIQVP